MEKEIELLSCPFCEGSAELRNDVDEYWYVSCNECINQTTHFFNGKDVVIARWNTRSREARLVEALEDLLEACRRPGEFIKGWIHSGDNVTRPNADVERCLAEMFKSMRQAATALAEAKRIMEGK